MHHSTAPEHSGRRRVYFNIQHLFNLSFCSNDRDRLQISLSISLSARRDGSQVSTTQADAGKMGSRPSEQHHVGRKDQASQEGSIAARRLFKKAVFFVCGL